MRLKIVSVNVEKDRHKETVKKFLDQESAEVVCLMEVCEADLGYFAGDKYKHISYIPNVRLADGGTAGVAIISELPLNNIEKITYGGRKILELEKSNKGTHLPVLILAEINEYQIGTIHGTWTEGGAVDDDQRQDVASLLDILADRELVLCGDFNIPRGNEMYQELLSRYKDNIPSSVVTTIDPELHAANKVERGKLSLVVDYAWSSPGYRVQNLRLVSGVSDHLGLVFEIDES